MILQKDVTNPRRGRNELHEVGGRQEVPARGVDERSDLIGGLRGDLLVALEERAAKLIGAKRTMKPAVKEMASSTRRSP